MDNLQARLEQNKADMIKWHELDDAEYAAYYKEVQDTLAEQISEAAEALSSEDGLEVSKGTLPNSLSQDIEQILSANSAETESAEYGRVISFTPDALAEATSALTQLFNKRLEETSKAFGGCTNCYGKGYATWRHGETYRGATHNMRNDIKYCTCERGKQLEALLKEAQQ